MSEDDGRNHGAASVAKLEREGPDLKKIPNGQIEGDLWMVAVLDDLVAYADYRDNIGIAELLRSTRSKVANTLLH